MNSDPLVVACIPYFRCQQYIRRAVDSLLDQTYKNIIVVVINDADFETPPWPVLSDITDNRLVRYDLRENKGPYFATQVVLQSISADYLLIQDADDWSHKHRLQVLMSHAIANRSGLVFSTQAEVDKFGIVNGMRWAKEKQMNNINFAFEEFPTREFVNRAAHHGLFKAETLKRIGGYFGGFKINYDVFLTNLILMTSHVSHIDQPLYNYFVRPDSLSRGELLGYRSLERKKVRNILSNMYEEIYDKYLLTLTGHLSSERFIKYIQQLIYANIPYATKIALDQEYVRLSSLLYSQN